jgi:DNA excision repair protein ERCC-4
MNELNIIIDTREQKPLWKKSTKKYKIENKKLDVGDYSLKGYENKFALERKSQLDLFGTLGKDHKRFKKEILRALEYDYFAIIVEDNYDNILNKKFENSFRSKMRGYIITSILFTIHLKYKIPIFFANDRNEAKKIIKELMKAYLKIKNK